MAGYQRSMGMLMLVANVLLTLTEAQRLYQYPSQTHNWRQKFPQYTYPSPDRSYQTLHNPLNQPVKSHESVQSSKFPIQRYRTPYYSQQQRKLYPATHSTQQPITSWQPTKHPTTQPAGLHRHVHHLTLKPLAPQEPIHNTTHRSVEPQQPAYDPNEEHSWPRQHAHHPFQQITRSQQSINHSTMQHVTSQKPTHYSTQPPVRSQHHHTSQKPTQQSTLQPIRSQLPIRSQPPTHHSSHHPIISQQQRHYLPQQLLMSQQHTNYPSKQPTRSQQATNYPTQQPIWSQQPTHHLNQQPIRSQQPTHHLTQQSIRSQQSEYHTNQQPIKSRKPVHHANQQPIKSHQAHLIQKPQYHHAQLPNRRHQQAWYWHYYGNRYHQQRPQTTQAPSRPAHGNERIDSGQVLLPQPDKSIADSTFSSLFPNNTETFTTGRTPFTNATIIFTNSVTTTEKAVSTANLSAIPSTTLTTTIGISSATLPTESKHGTTAPIFGITSPSPLTTERTKIMTKNITSFLPINKTTTSKPEVSNNSTVGDLKNALTTYTADTSTTSRTSPTWPFTMKPVQFIVKTQKYAEVSSLTTNNNEDLSYHMNGTFDGKFEEKSLEEFFNSANGQVSNNVSQKDCCESKYLNPPPANKSQNLTKVTDVTTLSPLKVEEYGSDITDDIPKHNHDLLPHDNTATSQYPTEKTLTSVPNDNNTTHLHTATDVTLLLPSLSVSPHAEYNTSSPSTKGGDESSLSKNNVTFSQSLTKSDNLLPSKLLINDTSTSPVKETNPPLQQSYLSSHLTWRGYVHPKPTRAGMVTFEPQITGDPSTTSSPLGVPKEIKYLYQKDGQKEAIILPAGNQTFPKKAKAHPTHPQHKSHRLPVQQTSFPHLLDPGFPWNLHLNHPSSSNNHPMETESSQGILPQFNPANGLRFELTKLRETAAENNTKDVLPQFNPTSGLIFPLKESNNGANTKNSDSEDINNAPKDLQPDPFHTVPAPSLQKHLVNESLNSDITGANNAAEVSVTSKTNSQQQILLKPLYPQGLAHGLRHKPMLIQRIPPDQQPWRPIQDKPLEMIIPLELPDQMAPTRPLLSKKPTSEVSFNPSEAEALEFLLLTHRSQKLPQSQGLPGFPPAPEFTTMSTRSQELPPPAQSHEFPLTPIIQGQPLPTKQDVYLPVKQQKFPPPTKSQYLQSQRQTNSPSATRKQVLSKQSQYLFSTQGPLHLSPTQTIQSDLYLSLQNSSPPSTLLNESLGQQSQLLLQDHLPIQKKEKSSSSQGHFPTRIKENPPSHNLESSPQDHKLQQPFQHKLFDTPTIGQVHEPTTAAEKRYTQPESRGETLQNTHQFTSDYKEPFLPIPASHSSTFWPEKSRPTLTPIFHQPSVFASQIPYQSESKDYLLVKQSDKREIPDIQSTVSVSITPHATSTPTTIQEASELQSSSIIRNDERLVKDFLDALPSPFKGSVKVDRANLHNHNNVAISNSYGNVIYQHGGITFIGEEDNSDE